MKRFTKIHLRNAEKFPTFLGYEKSWSGSGKFEQLYYLNKKDLILILIEEKNEIIMIFLCYKQSWP